MECKNTHFSRSCWLKIGLGNWYNYFSTFYHSWKWKINISAFITCWWTVFPRLSVVWHVAHSRAFPVAHGLGMRPYQGLSYYHGPWCTRRCWLNWNVELVWECESMVVTTLSVELLREAQEHLEVSSPKFLEPLESVLKPLLDHCCLSRALPHQVIVCM